MRIGLIDVDRYTFPRMTFPNLALMKISAYHKAQGDTVKWCIESITSFDVVYQAKVFDETLARDLPFVPNADRIIKGGTGYGLDNTLPEEIEHIYPDYHLYDGTPAEVKDTAYGFLSRGCPRHCDFCIVGDKEGLKSHKVADLSEFWDGQRIIKLLDPNILACPDYRDLFCQLMNSHAWIDFTQGLDARLCTAEAIAWINSLKIKRLHFAWDDPKQNLLPHFERLNDMLMEKDHRKRIVYVLTNHGSTLQEDLYRIYTLENLGFDADVRIFDNPNAPKEIRRLQRWCNNRIIHARCKRFEDYKEG